MSWLSEHHSYACDTQRTSLYQNALAKVVGPTDHVLDLGCGVGILGALSLVAGAARVTGIEETLACDAAADVYRVASPTARVAAIHASSFEVTLEDRADLILCDHVGYFGLDYGILPLLQDARMRFLAPGGRIMPSGLTLHMAPVGSEECRRIAYGWSLPGIPEALHLLKEQSIAAKHSVMLGPDHVLGATVELGHIDFMTETGSFFSYHGKSKIRRAGEVHGLAGWFHCTLCEGITMTNDPTASKHIDRYQAFFPIEAPLSVVSGDAISFSVSMRPDEGVFAWTVHHLPSGKRFQHTTLNSMPIRKQELQAADQSHVPHPSELAKAGQIVMAYCDGKRSVAEIRDAVLQDHPDMLPSRKASEDFINTWLTEWTR